MTLSRLVQLLAGSALAAGGAVVAEGSRSEVQVLPVVLGVAGLILAMTALWQARGLPDIAAQATAIFVTLVYPLLTALMLDIFGYGIEMRGIAYATFALWAAVLWLGTVAISVVFALRWKRGANGK